MSMDQIPMENQQRRQRFEAMLESHIGETGDYEHGREKLVDELTFTLFNRLAAVKVMEAANLFPPIITRRAEHGGRSFGHKAWLESNPHQRDEELEGLRSYIKSAFDELGASLPLFSSNYPFSLFPDTINLNEIIDLFNAVERDSQIDDDIWESDDILGWCYESYNNSRKKELKDSGAKIEYNYVSLQSQVYTPRWVVQFLVDNSLGKLYLEMFPDSQIKNQFKIANTPSKRERDPKPLHEVTIIDPACGSGNFLLYAFDLFYELYLDQIENYGADYVEADIPQLIIENNLHGIDLDDRAVQIAQLGLFIKARKKRRSMREFNYRVVSSDFFLPDYTEVAHVFEVNSKLGKRQKELVAEIWEDLQYAYKFGSLLRIKEKVEGRLHSLFAQQGGRDPNLFTEKESGAKESLVQTDAFFEQDVATEREFIAGFFTNLRTAVDQYARSEKNSFMALKTQDAITFLELLTTEYDVASANPPYTDSSDLGVELKKFIEDNYKKPFKFHTNLYATFIKRCYELTRSDGRIALIHPDTFMFISSFEAVRQFILNKLQIDCLVHFGTGGVFGTALRVVYPAMYIMDKRISDTPSIVIDLRDIKMDPTLEREALIRKVQNQEFIFVHKERFKIIPSNPFLYWISDQFVRMFSSNSIGNVLKIKNGLQTGNNDRYLRFWWEIAESRDAYDAQQKWVLYSKGGAKNKWFGNLWVTASRYEENVQIGTKGFFQEGINFSGTGSLSFRYLPEGNLFDNDAPLIFNGESEQDIFYTLAFLNTPLSTYITKCLNPTIKTQVGDVRRIPYIMPESSVRTKIGKLSRSCVKIKERLTQGALVELLYKNPLLFSKGKMLDFLNHENHRVTQILICEAVISEMINDAYNLTLEDKQSVLASEGVRVGSLSVVREARDAFLVESLDSEEFSIDDLRQYIEELPIEKPPHQKYQEIKNNFPTLYQSNNDLEEFCVKYQVNPINVWYWFKQSDVLPKQRMQTLAMELLVDLVREILMEDEDGIIPLVPNSGEKVLVDRIEEKFIRCGVSSGEYAKYENVLGRSVSEYLKSHFFSSLSDHLNLFLYLPKTPFIWHLSSGPDQGFDCYIIIYKWSRDNLLRLRSVYIENRERALVNRQSDLADSESASAQNEKELIFRQLQEIETFKKKIDELLVEGYDPTLDDGVGKNIAPLQKKGMLSYNVLNPRQLRKYLNADW